MWLFVSILEAYVVECHTYIYIFFMLLVAKFREGIWCVCVCVCVCVCFRDCHVFLLGYSRGLCYLLAASAAN